MRASKGIWLATHGRSAAGRPAFYYYCVLIFLAATPAFLGPAAAADLATVPDASFSPPASAGGDSCFPIISPDGRFVLFGSTANNLAVTSNNGPYRLQRPIHRNVFLHDRSLGTNLMASADLTDTTGGSDDSNPAAVSTNGQFALFESGATNLTTGQTSATSGKTGVFIRDFSTHSTRLVSVNTNGESANDASTDSVMTPNGRYVAFSSLASDLVPNDTNGISDVFVRDLQNGTTVCASAGAQATVLPAAYQGVSSSDLPEITPDGRWVAFLSTATNLVAGGTNPGELYVRDLASNMTICASTNADQYCSSLVCFSHRLSTDGKYVAFEAFSAAAATNPGIIFRHNLQSGADDLVSSNAARPADFYKYIQLLDMTPDGRFIAYVANSNFSAGQSVVVWDGQTAATNLVTIGTNGAAPQAKSTCDSPLIDPTGRFVSFRGTAANLVTNVTYLGYPHLFVRDLQAGTTTLVDIGTNTAIWADNFVGSQSMDSSGNYIAFDSTRSDLTTNDSNGSADVFVYDLTARATELVSTPHPALTTATAAHISVSHCASLSTDGHYLAFATTGNGMVPGYTSAWRGVFVRDLAAQTNLLVSVPTNGVAAANGQATEPMISGNGRYVVFSSYASNLVKNDTNHTSDVFIRDLQNGTTSLVSLNAAANGSANGQSFSPTVSSDGRFVLFYYNNYDNGTYNLILRDRSANTSYMLLTNNVIGATMTPDGHYVAFLGQLTASSSARLYLWDALAAKRVFTNTTLNPALVAISTNGQRLAYATASALYLVDWLSNKSQTIGKSGVFGPHTNLKFSGDGTFLVYSTTATNTPESTNGLPNVFLYNSATGTNLLVSRRYASAGAANGASGYCDLSADGRYVVYESTASDLVPADNNHFKDVFLYDQQTGTTTLLSASILGAGAANYESLAPKFIGDGQTIVFQSFASDLTPNDFGGGSDLFLLQLSTTNAQSNPVPFAVGQIIYAPGSGQSGLSPTLTWTAAAGTSYQVLYKDELTDPAWQPLNGSVTVLGSQGHAVDFAPNSDHRFYKILANSN